MSASKLSELKQQQQSLLEQELMREQAGSLGVAGKTLEQALQDYRRHHHLSPRKKAEYVRVVADAVYNLMLTRELLGFVDGNLEWVCGQYDIPDAVLQHMALS
ncbi:hypothetical protein [Shewanella algae]|uniref:hypothetical protein n=1 Tax=Shewanella algae TaxID=38313 RepID=UPI001AAD3DE0|nr:hypothetical protein [Shewanella algae]MBO2591788.1 hypothetical protein [Shewanella algae]MBO2650498.1 hypothetical protein [Shewanella algae]